MRQNVQFSVSQVGRRSATGWPESLSRRGSRLGKRANRRTDGQRAALSCPARPALLKDTARTDFLLAGPGLLARAPRPAPRGLDRSPAGELARPELTRRRGRTGRTPASQLSAPAGGGRGRALWEPQGRRAGGGGASGPVAAVPLPCARAERRLRSAPLGGAGAGGVAVCRQDFVGDAAALPLVHPLLGAQVRGVLVFAGLFRCFAQAS